jgi:ABC-2 type transport system ATP-binding protein
LGIILNIVNKTSGEYSWFGGKMQTQKSLKKVGTIIERPNFYPYLTAKENLELVGKIKNTNYAKVEEN